MHNQYPILFVTMIRHTLTFVSSLLFLLYCSIGELQMVM